ncbi:MAG: DUF4339 domain-containing protein [Gluconobacter oxydans]|uniref:DUF4339 domain-containing protein n=1 Tax=Gluconobacter oxydans TaxID=442 RepID=UPI0039EC28B1
MSWFYEEHGTRKGPVSADGMKALVTEGIIGHSTLCWTESFGGEWHPAGSCVFWPPQPEGVPPALPASLISNRWLWLSLIGPFFGSMAIGILEGFGLIPEFASNIGTMVVSVGIFYCALIMDRRSLLAAGFRPGTILWILLPPLYFWRRIQIVGHGMLLFFLSVLVFLCEFIPAITNGWHIMPNEGLSSYVSRRYYEL